MGRRNEVDWASTYDATQQRCSKDTDRHQSRLKVRTRRPDKRVEEG